VLTNKQLKLQNTLRIEDLSKGMNSLWRMHAVSTGIKKEEDELIINAFEGFCFGCKKKGHKAHQCPEKKG
jgi:hypothetical protein